MSICGRNTSHLAGRLTAQAPLAPPGTVTAMEGERRSARDRATILLEGFKATNELP